MALGHTFPDPDQSSSLKTAVDGAVDAGILYATSYGIMDLLELRNLILHGMVDIARLVDLPHCIT